MLLPALSEVELDPIADSGLLPLERLAKLTLLIKKAIVLHHEAV